MNQQVKIPREDTKIKKERKKETEILELESVTNKKLTVAVE